MSSDNWMNLLIFAPAFEDRFDWSSWTRLSMKQWMKLMDYQPEIAIRHFPWDELDKESWELILQAHPQFWHICPHEDLHQKYRNVSEPNQAAKFFRAINASEVMKKYANVIID